MKRFILKTVAFFVPVLLIILCIEIYLRTSESVLRLKANSLLEKESVDVLVLGSSHAQNGINPRFLDYPTANLSYGSQDLKLDVALLKKAISVNKRPRVVFLEFSYHRLLRENPYPYWRNGLYENFYDVDLSDRFSLSRYLLISSNAKFFRNFILENLSRKKTNGTINAWGFNENDLSGVFNDSHYDSLNLYNTKAQRLSIDTWGTPADETLQRNITYIEEIADLCSQNGIHLLFVAPPVYETYSSFFNATNLQLRSEVITKLRNKHPTIIWMNFENSKQFGVTHFANDDHLNSDGAAQFTEMLNDSLQIFPFSSSLGKVQSKVR